MKTARHIVSRINQLELRYLKRGGGVAMSVLFQRKISRLMAAIAKSSYFYAKNVNANISRTTYNLEYISNNKYDTLLTIYEKTMYKWNVRYGRAENYVIT